MNTHVPNQALSAFHLSREQVADLIVRYPQLSEAEAKLILAFLRKGRHLDVGMLTADERLKPQLDSFMADHARHFRVSPFEGSVLVGAILAFLAICWLVWEAAKPALGHF